MRGRTQMKKKCTKSCVKKVTRFLGINHNLSENDRKQQNFRKDRVLWQIINR